jgi:hypothetical protein
LTLESRDSEEQRRYIVQAEALSQQKDYGRAIDLNLKPVGLDPASYPGAYFDLALLSPQLHRFNPAVSYIPLFQSVKHIDIRR